MIDKEKLIEDIKDILFENSCTHTRSGLITIYSRRFDKIAKEIFDKLERSKENDR